MTKQAEESNHIGRLEASNQLKKDEIERLAGELEACHVAYKSMAEIAKNLKLEVGALGLTGGDKDKTIATMQAHLDALQADLDAQAPRLQAMRGFMERLGKLSATKLNPEMAGIEGLSLGLSVSAQTYESMPRYDGGGVVKETGPAILHKGEVVIAADEAAQGSAEAGSGADPEGKG